MNVMTNKLNRTKKTKQLIIGKVDWDNQGT